MSEEPEGVNMVRLPDDAVATCLAYALTGGPPDTALRQAAARSELRTTEGITFHAERLLKTVAARTMADAFFTQWLHLERLDSVTKDPAHFPQFNETVRESMRTGLHAFLGKVLFDSADGSLKELLTSQS